MTRFDRRDFLRFGAASVALGALAPIFKVRFLAQAVHAASLGPVSPRRLIYIFLRGGMDSVNTVIPHGDSTYNNSPAGRPTLFIDPTESLGLNGFCALHPRLDKLLEVHAGGDLAVLHKIAMNGQSRSHFDSQHYWETGVPGTTALEEGWLNRAIATDLDLEGHPLPGVSIANQLQVMFQGPRVIPQFTSLSNYTLGAGSSVSKLIGAAPMSNGELGRGLLGVFSRPGDASDYDQLVRDNGLAMTGSLEALALVSPAGYMPENGATYPSAASPDPDDPLINNNTAYTFFSQVRDAVQLLKETDCRVIGIDLGGWDTHSNQGRLTGAHPMRLGALAHALRSIRRDLQPSGIWNDTIVVVASEFGRTSRENAATGTDHGHGGVMFVAGGSVLGQGAGGTGGLSGVYNADPTTWANGDLFAVQTRYLAMRTDYRAVYAEILQRHLGVPAIEVEAILPGWAGLPAAPEYAFLNFLS